MTVIEMRDVTFSYGSTPAVQDASLSLHEGEFLGLIGPNGSGKTTLVKLMLGLLSPDSGTVTLFGTEASSFGRGSRVGYVSQEASAVERRIPVTVEEAVRMGRYAHAGFRPLGAEDGEAVASAMEKTGITDLSDRRVGELSGGQKQRVFISRALASDADLLVLDEPAGGVDAESRDRFYTLLDDLNRDGITVVLIEHDTGVVTTYADRIVCMNRKLFCHCQPGELLEGDAVEKAYGSKQCMLNHSHPDTHRGH